MEDENLAEKGEDKRDAARQDFHLKFESHKGNAMEIQKIGGFYGIVLGLIELNRRQLEVKI